VPTTLSATWSTPSSLRCLASHVGSIPGAGFALGGGFTTGVCSQFRACPHGCCAARSEPALMVAAEHWHSGPALMGVGWPVSRSMPTLGPQDLQLERPSGALHHHATECTKTSAYNRKRLLGSQSQRTGGTHTMRHCVDPVGRPLTWWISRARSWCATAAAWALRGTWTTALSPTSPRGTMPSLCTGGLWVLLLGREPQGHSPGELGGRCGCGKRANQAMRYVKIHFLLAHTSGTVNERH
jgi:hypothetical protein